MSKTCNTCGNVISSFEFLGSICSGMMKYICSICRTHEVSLIQLTQVTRPWGCSCHPETSKLHTGNMDAILWEYFPILEDSRPVTANYLIHIRLMVEHYDAEQVTRLNLECSYMAVRYKQSFSPLKTFGSHSSHSCSLAQRVFHYCSAPEDCCVLHLLYGQSLSLLDTICRWISIANIHTLFFRFLDFTDLGTVLKFTLWN